MTDSLTKHVPRAVLDKLAAVMGYTFPDEQTSKVSRVHEHQSELLGSEIVERLPVFRRWRERIVGGLCSHLRGQNVSSHGQPF